MWCRERVLCLLSVLVLAGVVALSGCAKKPVVTSAGPAIVGPGATVTTTTPGAGGVSQGGEVAVVRPTPPTETPIGPRPSVSSSALPGATAGAGAGVGAGAGGMSPLKDVFFQYDRAIIEADQRAALDENVRWLMTNARVRIVVEGHCDERGTAEYNLGLGERRAKAVRDYLVTAGVAPSRISTISYGKERAFVPGHDESAWRQNRRAHFSVQGG
ncbi:MAG: peptidoglycan-associated lipoprotein Pal [Zetaproteobacteria bacterium]|nr:MAG: peptidoglycan-associated lipoprotein Pal [Zetaproteobacteria bacterium]